jgi:ribosome-binding factor A
MMVSQSRAGRIANRIRELLSEMLIFEVTDPRIQGIYITEVHVDRALSLASVYVSALEGGEREAEVMDGFKHAAGFLRSALAARVDLRSFPKLRFLWDDTPEKAERIEKLIVDLHRQEPTKQNKTKRG